MFAAGGVLDYDAVLIVPCVRRAAFRSLLGKGSRSASLSLQGMVKQRRCCDSNITDTSARFAELATMTHLYHHPSGDRRLGRGNDRVDNLGRRNRTRNRREPRPPWKTCAQLRFHIIHKTNVEHDFSVGEIHKGLSPPTSVHVERRLCVFDGLSRPMGSMEALRIADKGTWQLEFYRRS